jgi:intein/homing endonuclease
MEQSNKTFHSTEAIVSTSFLEATPNHPVMTKQGIKPLSEIKINDIIYLYSENTRKEVKVVSIKPTNYSASKVYNLITGSDNYFVNGVMVMMK